MATTFQVNDRVRFKTYDHVPMEHHSKVRGQVFRVSDRHPLLPLVEITNDTTGDVFTVGEAQLSLMWTEEKPKEPAQYGASLLESLDEDELDEFISDLLSDDEEEELPDNPCNEIPLDDDEPMTAGDFLRAAGETLIDRGKSRDDGQERSMARAIRAFNAMTDHDLTEEEGWLFMRYLKDSRARSGEYNRDDYLDGVGYAVLQAECADREASESLDEDERF